MRIGYPCINRSIGCKSSKTFRLNSYSETRLREIVNNNLKCLMKILKYNKKNHMLFFRITSDLVPFASHPVCEFDWQGYFSNEFGSIGDYVRENDMRISMHPDQFNVLNSKRKDVVENSVRELIYHAEVLDTMGLDRTHKIQIHVGGMYRDKKGSMARFQKRYKSLDIRIKKRLVIENDHGMYNTSDCLDISAKTGIPVLFDFFHESLNPSGMSLKKSLKLIEGTWKRVDGIPMVDYSHHHSNPASKKHAETIKIRDFHKFLVYTRPYDMDIMLEIKDKEKSAIRAVELARKDSRFLIVHR
ncbi:MAG: UV DNA damage repair endonuclease UvsE [Thermoplasmata archaeon]|nr:MAG: UV DNA damage repair endonuclease UvsE [Thermoplasmata archaeon]